MNQISIGVCTAPDKVSEFADAGLDFWECCVSVHLNPLLSDAEFGNGCEAIKNTVLPCKTANGFFPWDRKLVGPDADEKFIDGYTERAIRRAAECGIETMVFGSGNARKCPDGFPMERAAEQIRRFLEKAAPVLEKYGVTIAIEPLNPAETNNLNTVASGAALVNRINHPRIKLLADAYHFLKSDNQLDSLTWCVPVLRHVHLATKEHRLAPGMEPCDLQPFLSILKHGGYSGRFSLECGLGDEPAKNAAAAVQLIREGLLR